MINSFLFPVIISSGGGNLSHKDGIALWIVLNFLLIIGLIIGYFLRRDKLRDYPIYASIFFDEDYERKYLRDFNFLTWGLITINGLAGVVALSCFVATLL